MKLAIAIMLALFVPACATTSLIGPASPADDPSWDRAQTPDDDVDWPAEQQALKHAIHRDTHELIFGPFTSRNRDGRPAQRVPAILQFAVPQAAAGDQMVFPGHEAVSEAELAKRRDRYTSQALSMRQLVEHPSDDL